MNLKNLKMQELDLHLKKLAQKERELLHDFLLALREVDARKMYLDFGFGSLFDYLTQSIGYSAGAAQRRIDAARLLRDIPELGPKIASGEIKLVHTSLIQKAARQASKERSQSVSIAEKKELLTQVAHLNTKETQQEVAHFFDLPIQMQSSEAVQADGSVRLGLTLSKELHEKVQCAQQLISHAVPSRDLAEFLDYVAGKIIQQKTNSKEAPKQNSAVPAKSANFTPPPSNSTATMAVTSKDLPPEESEIAVGKNLSTSHKKLTLSEQKCCQYKSPLTGKICGNKWFSQIDHKHPRWANGSHELKNLQVLCAQHNNLKYRREMGIRLISSS